MHGGIGIEVTMEGEMSRRLNIQLKIIARRLLLTIDATLRPTRFPCMTFTIAHCIPHCYTHTPT